MAFPKGKTAWNKGMSGEEYRKHFKDPSIIGLQHRRMDKSSK